MTVDRRPLGATVSDAPGTQPVAVLAVSAQMTPSEREALQKAVSVSYLEGRGLKEGSHGEIVNERGRTVFLRWASLVLSARYLVRIFPNSHEKAPTLRSARGSCDALRCIFTS